METRGDVQEEDRASVAEAGRAARSPNPGPATYRPLAGGNAQRRQQHVGKPEETMERLRLEPLKQPPRIHRVPGRHTANVVDDARELRKEMWKRGRDPSTDLKLIMRLDDLEDAISSAASSSRDRASTTYHRRVLKTFSRNSDDPFHVRKLAHSGARMLKDDRPLDEADRGRLSEATGLLRGIREALTSERIKALRRQVGAGEGREEKEEGEVEK